MLMVVLVVDVNDGGGGGGGWWCCWWGLVLLLMVLVVVVMLLWSRKWRAPTGNILKVMAALLDSREPICIKADDVCSESTP